MKKYTVILPAAFVFVLSLSLLAIRLRTPQNVSADAPRGSGVKITLAANKLMQPNESLKTPDLGFPRAVTVCGRCEYNLLVEGSMDGKNFYRMGNVGGDGGACAAFPAVSYVRMTFPSYKATEGVPPTKASAEVEAIY
jgi:hypothetical protein